MTWMMQVCFEYYWCIILKYGVVCVPIIMYNIRRVINDRNSRPQGLQILHLLWWSTMFTSHPVY